MKGIFVTGTDTGVGKTVVCAALMSAFRTVCDVCYWKPVQTGIEEDDDTAVVRNLAACRGGEVFDAGIRLKRPFSPHLSARLAGVRIAVDAIAGVCENRPPEMFWIVEGAGGILVPLNKDEMMIDLIRRVGLPALVVARSTLGTINHTLLTLEALRARGIVVRGVVLNGPRNEENKKAIERFGRARVLAELVRIDDLGPEALNAWALSNIDTAGLGLHRGRQVPN